MDAVLLGQSPWEKRGKKKKEGLPPLLDTQQIIFPV